MTRHLFRRASIIFLALVVGGGTAIAVEDPTPLPAVDPRLALARRQEGDSQLREAATTLERILAEPEGLDPAARAAVGNDLARVRLMLGAYSAAMEAATAAAAEAELAGDRSAQAYAEFMVGMIHRNLKQLDEAGSAFRASARLALDADDTDQYLRAVNEESNSMVLAGDLEGALERKLEALQTAGPGVESATTASLENDLAFVYSSLGRHREATPHYRRAWQLNLDLGLRREAAIAACNLASNAATLGEIESAITWAQRGLDIADADGLLPEQELAHATLGELLAAAGRHEQAVTHLRLAYELREKTLNEESARRIADLGSRHEAERREAEISLLRRDAEIRELQLEREQTLTRLLVGGIAALVAFVVVLAAAYRIKVRANRQIRAANLELELARRRVEELSRTDPLTGLANRRAVDERLIEEARRSERSGRPFALIMADIDHFKLINDSLGHGAGDDVLRELAVRLRGALRAVDTAGRWGGEEFLLVLPDTDAAGAARLADKLRQAVAASPMLAGGEPVSVTVTLGVAAHEGSDIDATIRRADQALYRGKSEGRNRVVSD